MEKFPSSSEEEKKKDMICYGVAWTKAESLTKGDTSEDKKFQNTDVEDVKSDSVSLPKQCSFDTKELKIEILSTSQSMATRNDDEFESRNSPRKLKPIMREVERLEMQKETLENKIEELKEKLSKRRYKKEKESSSLQIKNTEKKIEMLEKRIAYENRRTNIPLSRWKSVKTLTRASKSLYSNNMRSDDVLARKMRAKLVLREEGKESEDSGPETLNQKEKNLNKWEIRWKELVLEEESDEEMEIYGFVIKKPKRTTVFCPPIPDPMGKKRPKDVQPLRKRGSIKQGKSDSYKNTSEGRIRLVPNRRRVLTKRAKVYEKQLEFANKYGLEKEDILDNLNNYQQKLNDGELAPSVTKQQLHLIGALSGDHVSP